MATPFQLKYHVVVIIDALFFDTKCRPRHRIDDALSDLRLEIRWDKRSLHGVLVAAGLTY